MRAGVPLDINELDVYALTEAVRLREVYGGEVIAITMGPPPAHEALAIALAIGVNRAIHLSDRAFGGRTQPQLRLHCLLPLPLNTLI